LVYDLEGMVKVTAKDPKTGIVLEQITDEDAQTMVQTLINKKTGLVLCELMNDYVAICYQQSLLINIRCKNKIKQGRTWITNKQ